MAENFYLKVKGRETKVGELTDRGSFVKIVQSSKHLFKIGNAYGIASVILDKLLLADCKRVILYELENDEKWTVDFNVFMAKSWSYKAKNYEEQRLLAKPWWTIRDTSGSPSDDIKIKQYGKKFELVVQNENQLKMNI